MDNYQISKQSVCSTKECIIAQKIFDQRRIQVCLTPSIIGPAKAAGQNYGCCNAMVKGDAVVPPTNAVTVIIKNLCVADITVLSKTPSSLRFGYWDVAVKFTFSYCLTFYDSDSMEISTVSAYSTYTRTIPLYGGEGSCVAQFNELYPCNSQNGPFVAVEANAMALAACLSYPCPPQNVLCGTLNTLVNNCECTSPSVVNSTPVAVNVTIGLFAVIKLFRLSNMKVENYGDCMPEEITGIAGEFEDPCVFFDSLDFPINLFAPQSDYTPSTDEGAFYALPGNNCCEDKTSPANKGCCK